VVVQPGMVDLVGAAAASVPASEDHVPKHSAILFASKLSKPGETLTFTFDAPKEPGNYEFLCTTPGHFALMRGKLIVQ
jgi:azurin